MFRFRRRKIKVIRQSIAVSVVCAEGLIFEVFEVVVAVTCDLEVVDLDLAGMSAPLSLDSRADCAYEYAVNPDIRAVAVLTVKYYVVHSAGCEVVRDRCSCNADSAGGNNCVRAERDNGSVCEEAYRIVYVEVVNVYALEYVAVLSPGHLFYEVTVHYAVEHSAGSAVQRTDLFAVYVDCRVAVNYVFDRVESIVCKRVVQCVGTAVVAESTVLHVDIGRTCKICNSLTEVCIFKIIRGGLENYLERVVISYAAESTIDAELTVSRACYVLILNVSSCGSREYRVVTEVGAHIRGCRIENEVEFPLSILTVEAVYVCIAVVFVPVPVVHTEIEVFLNCFLSDNASARVAVVEVPTAVADCVIAYVVAFEVLRLVADNDVIEANALNAASELVELSCDRTDGRAVDKDLSGAAAYCVFYRVPCVGIECKGYCLTCNADSIGLDVEPGESPAVAVCTVSDDLKVEADVRACADIDVAAVDVSAVADVGVEVLVEAVVTVNVVVNNEIRRSGRDLRHLDGASARTVAGEVPSACADCVVAYFVAFEVLRLVACYDVIEFSAFDAASELVELSRYSTDSRAVDRDSGLAGADFKFNSVPCAGRKSVRIDRRGTNADLVGVKVEPLETPYVAVRAAALFKPQIECDRAVRNAEIAAVNVATVADRCVEDFAGYSGSGHILSVCYAKGGNAGHEKRCDHHHCDNQSNDFFHYEYLHKYLVL